MNDIIFGEGSVPIAVAAKVYGKDAAWVRAGIIAGWLPIGVATRNKVQVPPTEIPGIKSGRINFYISPRKFFEHTGYIWRGEEE